MKSTQNYHKIEFENLHFKILLVAWFQEKTFKSYGRHSERSEHSKNHYFIDYFVKRKTLHSNKKPIKSNKEFIPNVRNDEWNRSLSAM